MNCKTLAETIAETLAPCASDDQKSEAIGNVLADLCAYTIADLAEDAARHYRVEIDAETLPKYHLPETPGAYADRLAFALAHAGVWAALVFILRNS